MWRNHAGRVVFMIRMNEKRHSPSPLLCRKAQLEFHINLQNFLRDLRERGYSPGTVRSYGRAAEHFGRWLCKNGIRPCRIVPIHLDTFLRGHLLRCRCPNPGCKSFGLCRSAVGCFIGFPNRYGEPLSRFGAFQQIRKLVRRASAILPTLKQRPISPHLFRHATAMYLLKTGTTPEVIALWMGHESFNMTHHYVEADLAMKKKALQGLAPPNAKSHRFRPKDELLRFLESL